MTGAGSPAPRGPGRRAYQAVFACAALTALVAVAFFLIGIADGSVSSFNITLWLALLGGMGLCLAAGVALHARGRLGLAIAALALVAVPGLLALFFLLVVIIARPNWH